MINQNLNGYSLYLYISKYYYLVHKRELFFYWKNHMYVNNITEVVVSNASLPSL